jgi:proline iminopeptidase
MRNTFVVAVIVSAGAAASCSGPTTAPATGQNAAPRETRVPVGNTSLYVREIGQGQPVVILHGGPDFDHSYLLPDMDRLSDEFRLIYYDQRGRGRSVEGVKPEDVTLESDIGDLDRVREYLQLGSAMILGHSWGTVLALEYALRHPDRVSHLVLMNPGPASADDYASFRKAYVERLGADLDRQREIMASAAYKAGEPETVAARYRLHFKPALQRPEDYERLMATMKAAFIRQGKEGIVEARAVEDRLMADTWSSNAYDLLPKLKALRIPTLVIFGDHDFIPFDTAAHIAGAIPNARLVTFKACGHFSYLECPDAVRKSIDEFFQGTRTTARLP